jgi:hypothetical protein
MEPIVCSWRMAAMPAAHRFFRSWMKSRHTTVVINRLCVAQRGPIEIELTREPSPPAKRSLTSKTSYISAGAG